MTAAIVVEALGAGEEIGAAVSAWGGEGAGAAVSEASSMASSAEIDLGGGFKMKIKSDGFRSMMHTPEMTAAVEKRCRELAERCNELAITAGALYGYTVSTNPTNIRARGRVRPLNYKAVVDDAAHSTLLKALASVGSDPVHIGPSPEAGPQPGGHAE